MQPTTKIATTVLVLGGGYAGLSAATRVAQLPGTKVVLIDARNAFFERIRLHEDLCRSGARRWHYGDLLSKHGIEFVQGTVVNLDPLQCSVTIEQTTGLLTLIGDYVLYALGSYPNRNAIPGLESFGHTLTDLNQVQYLATAMARNDTPRVVVGGGGLTAVELASELSESYPDAHITLVSSVGLDPHDDPGGLSRRACAHIRRTLTSLGVATLESQRVISLEPTMANLSDGESVQFDHYIHAAGFIVPDLARLSGLAVDDEGRILVDDAMRSLSHSRVLAAGDAAHGRTTTGHTTRMSCAAALPMGIFAANTLRALLNEKEPDFIRISFAVRNISLGRHEGLIQFVDDDDHPLDKIWTGRKAVQWKEFICRGTLSTIRLEPAPPMRQIPPLRLLPRLYRLAKQTK